MKPIHKFNGGLGATLCHKCSVIITTGLTDDLYCNKCKQETLECGNEAQAIILIDYKPVFDKTLLQRVIDKASKNLNKITDLDDWIDSLKTDGI
jgi:hypothetical protein